MIFNFNYAWENWDISKMNQRIYEGGIIVALRQLSLDFIICFLNTVQHLLQSKPERPVMEWGCDLAGILVPESFWCTFQDSDSLWAAVGMFQCNPDENIHSTWDS